MYYPDFFKTIKRSKKPKVLVSYSYRLDNKHNLIKTLESFILDGQPLPITKKSETNEITIKEKERFTNAILKEEIRYYIESEIGIEVKHYHLDLSYNSYEKRLYFTLLLNFDNFNTVHAPVDEIYEKINEYLEKRYYEEMVNYKRSIRFKKIFKDKGPNILK